MVRILALDTSTEACSVALKLGDQVVENFQLQPRKHTQLLLPMVEEILADAGIKLQQLDAIAFANGPGSFTGLRIATGVTQGLAFGADLPVIPVTTLETMAFTLFRERFAHYIISSLDARMGEVYWAAYHWNGNGFDCITQPEVIAPDQVSLVKPIADADWVGAGSGWQLLDQFSPVMQSLVQQTYPDLLPKAGDIARLAELYWQQNKTVSAEDAIPVYLRDNVAFKKGEGPHKRT
ncbi:tRNA (adenosine(37)-N6)-threonylcarbamoyltransferase complex dimerization subunit type 1 TsaB [Oceanospirillum linum]|uniref:tRNA threonylcarbamoyladenosine biosynthesis protein TsaB n=1 Tax=Oceanospirillum linum TaxID=966 RepID=A0A1T1HA09_OCELI|nr:tRNA (adenosine(37)-N6)-threonylcarbamoyltransferase complex dimerization subunit type 1 TsaB [Oceanospirillum linum]OOV86570.1 tRNA (adenosine(37)-N6)-threonylcarbamoyltransferase complex dimerization subunit type 1 TsaB [Oceanospirillum linum]SEG29678.1 tRNA threonylcarbamoyladenosine biosynthesis protein TsaB [Oleiphilus messinensis]SMP26244.1 tRNA threonylcarbamoyladenosine biosynthesis protein TsaB [Oceanospirillum linum]